jgi:Domain of unknown function (DUF4164)
MNGMRDEPERMTEGGTLERATRRLAAALDGLEAALERRREADRSEAALAAQVSALGADRSRLAAELDQQAARAHRLKVTGREVSQRLEVTMDALRAVAAAEDR